MNSISRRASGVSLDTTARGLVKLDFSHLPLYGRFQERLSIVTSLNRIAQEASPAEVVLLFGKSGAGKTCLTRDCLMECEDTHLIGEGKFEQFLTSKRPYAAIVDALSDLIDKIILQGEFADVYAERISDALDDESYRITTLIPKLIELMGERPAKESKVQTTHDITSFMRLLNLLQATLRAICGANHNAIVLVLDGLNYADPESLAIIKYLANDKVMTNLLIICCVEDYGSDAMGDVSDILESIDLVKTTLIRVDSIDVDNINRLIADVMEMPIKATKKLAKLIYKRTKGNALFTIQMLELIQELGLIQFNVQEKIWEWDMDAIKNVTKTFEKATITEDKVKYAIAARLNHLPRPSKLVLATAACIGSSFDVKTLAWLLKDKRLHDTNGYGGSNGLRRQDSAASFMSAMMLSFRSVEGTGSPAMAVEEILRGLETIGMVEETSTMHYRFAHDRIEQCAYGLTPQLNREEKHWQMGQHLKRYLSKHSMEDDVLFFTVVDQLNRGARWVVDEEECLELSSLNLRAAYKAKDRSAFAAAAKYAYTGIENLGEDKWEIHNSLTLKLLNLAAEMALACGDDEICMQCTREAIQNGRIIDEKIPSYFLQVKLNAQNGRAKEAFKTALEVLRELGEKFGKPNTVNIALNLSSLRKMIQGKTDDMLLSMPKMMDDSKVITMRFLALAARYAAATKSTKAYVPVIECRMFNLTVSHGICDESILAFSGYSILVAETNNDYEEAYRFGNLAVQLQQLRECHKYQARVAYQFYGFVQFFRGSFHNSLMPLQQAYRTGMRCGEIEDALDAIGVYCLHYLFSGRPLGQLAHIFPVYLQLMKEYKPTLYLTLVPFGQLVENLMGRAPDPLVLNGNIMELEATMAQMSETGSSSGHRSVLLARLELAFWFLDYGDAYKILMQLDKLKLDSTFLSTFHARRLVFLEGLVSVGLAKAAMKSIYTRAAQKCCRRVQKFVDQGSVDCRELLSILQAEIASASSKSNPLNLTRGYNDAIKACLVSMANHNVALCNELAGHHQKKMGDVTTAVIFLQQAHLCYTEWNAYEKAQQLVERNPSLEWEKDEHSQWTADLAASHSGNVGQELVVAGGSSPHRGHSRTLFQPRYDAQGGNDESVSLKPVAHIQRI